VKLQESEGVGFDPKVAEFVTGRLGDLGGSEEAALYGQDDEGLSRALVAADIGLLDCRYLLGRDDNPNFEIRLIPWDEVPAPWIVIAGFVDSPGGWAVETRNTTFRLALDPPFSLTVSGKATVKPLVEFDAAVRRHRLAG